MKHALILLALAALGADAAAQTAISQPPTQKFALRAYAPTQAVADDFLVASPTTINGLAMWGTWTPTALPTTDTFDVIVHGNTLIGPFSDNAPGAVIATYSNVTPAVIATGATMPASSGPSNAEYQVIAPLSPPLVLAPGHYWIEVYSNSDSGTGEIFEWGMAAQDPIAGSPCVSFSDSTPGVNWNSCVPFPEKEMAFELYTVAPGPEIEVLNLVSGSTTTINVKNATPSSPVLVGFSLTGGTSTPTIFGDLLLSAPYVLLPGFPSDVTGLASQNFPVQPGLTGISVWLQGFDVASLTLTWNVVSTVIG